MKTKFILALSLAGSMGYAQVIWTMAGTGSNGNTGNGGFAQSATFGQPQGVAVDGSGNTYIADFSNSVVRKVNSKGIVSAFAGTGTAGYSGNGGAATSAQISHPVGIAVDGSGNVYIADSYNYVIRKVNTSGTISTFAGNNTSGYSGDGAAATSAQLSGATGVAVDGSGNVYIADVLNFVIRKVNTSGTISTVAGNNTQGYSGDNGPATSAQLNSPHGIAVDGSGNLYISDNGAYVVRKVSSGTITTFAGTGVSGYTGDGGAATSAKLNDVRNVCIYGSDVYIADGNNYVVRKVSSGTISTYAGTGTSGNSGNGGSPTSANLSTIADVTFDASGNAYIADIGHIVHEISANCPAIAGPNVHDQNTNCCPPPCTTTGVTIGSPSIPNMTYSWAASTNLSSTTVAQPTSTWCNTSTPTTYTVTVSGTGCTTATSTVTVTTNPAGTNCCRKIRPSDGGQSTLPSNFAAFPNPAKEQVTIDLYYQADYIKIVDVAGRVMFESKDVPMGELKINLLKYSKGMYIIESRIDNVIEKQKLIVE